MGNSFCSILCLNFKVLSCPNSLIFQGLLSSPNLNEALHITVTVETRFFRILKPKMLNLTPPPFLPPHSHFTMMTIPINKDVSVIFGYLFGNKLMLVLIGYLLGKE